MTVSADPYALTPEELVVLHARRARSRIVQKLEAGYSQPPETNVLSSILHVAVSHDAVCRFYDAEMYKRLGLKGRESGDFVETDDSDLNDFKSAVIDLCAAIAPAAQRRMAAAPDLVRMVAGRDLVENLSAAELEAFMRPIFDESGLAGRFVANSPVLGD